MDNLFFGGFMNPKQNNWGFSAVLNGLVDEATTYNIVYEAVMSNPGYVIFGDGDRDHKIRVISKMIKYFEVREEYEKCATLLRLKKELEK